MAFIKNITLTDDHAQRSRTSAKPAPWTLGALAFAVLTSPVFSQTAGPGPIPKERIVIAASTMLDGRGGMLHDTRIVIQGSEIVAIDAKAGPVDFDLRGLTVLPGWIGFVPVSPSRHARCQRVNRTRINQKISKPSGNNFGKWKYKGT